MTASHAGAGLQPLADHRVDGELGKSPTSEASNLAVRIAVRIVAILALLAGVVFFFQGIGVIPGSFMTGRSEWALIGAGLVTGGIALLGLSLIGRARAD